MAVMWLQIRNWDIVREGMETGRAKKEVVPETIKRTVRYDSFAGTQMKAVNPLIGCQPSQQGGGGGAGMAKQWIWS